jgi:hypothetical protein
MTSLAVYISRGYYINLWKKGNKACAVFSPSCFFSLDLIS